MQFLPFYNEEKHLKVRYENYHFNDMLCSVFYRNIKLRGSCKTEPRGKKFKEPVNRTIEQQLNSKKIQYDNLFAETFFVVVVMLPKWESSLHIFTAENGKNNIHMLLFYLVFSMTSF